MWTLHTSYRKFKSVFGTMPIKMQKNNFKNYSRNALEHHITVLSICRCHNDPQSSSRPSRPSQLSTQNLPGSQIFDLGLLNILKYRKYRNIVNIEMMKYLLQAGQSLHFIMSERPNVTGIGSFFFPSYLFNISVMLQIFRSC